MMNLGKSLSVFTSEEYWMFGLKNDRRNDRDESTR